MNRSLLYTRQELHDQKAESSTERIRPSSTAIKSGRSWQIPLSNSNAINLLPLSIRDSETILIFIRTELGMTYLFLSC